MNWDRVEGNWKQLTGKAKAQWGKLTDDTLTQVGGRRDELVGKIQESYGIGKDEAERQVNDWSSALDSGQGGQGYGGQGASEPGESRGQSLSEGLERAGRETAASVGRWAEGARQQAEQRTEELRSRINEQPLGMLAMAAGVGFILGVLLSRR